MTRVCTAKRSEIYLDTDHVDLDDVGTREYLSWQVDRCGTRHHMTASVVVREGLEAGISLHRSPAAGAFGARDKAALHKLFPSISHALQLGFRYQAALQESWWNGYCAASKGALVLVDELKRVVRLTPDAEKVIRSGDGLHIKQGRLSAPKSRDQEGLDRAIGNAVKAVDAVAGAVRIGRKSGAPDYLLTINPLVRQYRYLAPFEPAALIHIADPNRVLLPAKTLQRQLFGFTEQEANIAALLLEGRSPRAISELLSISTNTVNVHLQSVFRKTGTRRQSELIRLLLSTPR
jgi:DNA-binding CsgD family transcriptional regulator